MDSGKFALLWLEQCLAHPGFLIRENYWLNENESNNGCYTFADFIDRVEFICRQSFMKAEVAEIETLYL